MSNITEDDKKKREEEADAETEHRMRMRFDWDNLIEDLIQDGQERGAFDNLPGKGKPLKLDKNPFGAEWKLAHDLMKENDVLPPWIAQRNEIIAAIEQFRIDIGRVWARHEQAFRYAQGKGQKDALSLSWDNICRQWAGDLVILNKRIRDFNLGRPSDGLEMVALNLEKELTQAGARRYLL
jgi:hypothetical protein